MSTKKRISALIIGLLFLAGCAWFVLDAMGIELIQLESAWSIILIVIGFAGMFSGDGILFNIGLMLLGGGILARDNGWMGGALESVAIWQMIVALLLLVIGLSVIGGALGLNKHKWKKHVHVDCSVKGGDGECSAIFGEQNFDYSGQEFRGVDLNGIFGSASVDLREAVINEDCTIEANSVFGSVEIITGSNANYKVEGTGIFGSVNDHTNRTHIEGVPTVTVEASAVFGSVEIR